ncbi:Dehydrin ERD14 [Hirschfeldia incana]|nr:Dehydrin ERD14 [Hirschfeldia incana]
MAEETKNVHEHEVPKVVTEESSAATKEVTDRGLFDFLGKKKEETKPGETVHSEFEQNVQVSEPVSEVKHEAEEKKPSLLEKLHRSDSSSSSSSEEEGENGEKRKKKKDKKKIATEGEVQTEEEKKGFMDKLKEKLPGHGKKPGDASATPAAPVATPPVEETHPAEKKGIMEKIKEKLPGYHSKTVEEEKKDDH